MSVKVITYDLRSPHRDYAGLYGAIKSLDSEPWHCVESVWMVGSALSCGQIRDLLKAHIDNDDTVVVIGAEAGTWASYGLPKPCSDWLRRRL